jgi:hypothetical protein
VAFQARVRRRLIVVTILLAWVAIAPAASVARDNGAANSPAGLSADGRLLWEFEALLHDVFGDQQPYASSSSNDTNFACAGSSCFPHARWDPYSYIFSNARKSSFLLKSRTFAPGAFGNYPVPLRINGLYIACGPKASTFLTSVGGAAGFALSCERATP